VYLTLYKQYIFYQSYIYWDGDIHSDNGMQLENKITWVLQRLMGGGGAVKEKFGKAYNQPLQWGQSCKHAR